jgi:predicted phosphodiesterase
MEMENDSEVIRVYALSDVHVDYAENLDWLRAVDGTVHKNDVLLLAGDVSHKIERLEITFEIVARKFGSVFYVPGNHDLWVHPEEPGNSISKFKEIHSLCERMGIETQPRRFSGHHQSLWVVPLYSWYVRPEEGEDSLFMPKEKEDPDLGRWADSYYTRWEPLKEGERVADFFHKKNEVHLHQNYDAPIVTLSHFLPRKELMMSSGKRGNPLEQSFHDANPGFNFSRVAGSMALDKQIREIAASVHVYGHQHRNRDRVIEGVRYIAQCLGYPHERQSGQVVGIDLGPKLLWHSDRGFVEETSC